MNISLIVAMDQERGIGRDNKLPWHLPADLKHFKKLTTGHHIIMGRKTFESIGKALPDRTSIVVTRNMDFKAEGVSTVYSISEALALAQKNGADQVFIIGGAELYTHTLPLANTIYLTRIHTVIEGTDTFFPPIGKHWKVVDSQTFEADDRHAYAYTFETLKSL